MSSILIGLFVMCIWMAGCVPTPAPTPTLAPTPFPYPYTDEQAEAFLKRLPSVEGTPGFMPRSEIANSAVLAALGIDYAALEKRGFQGNIGDCIDHRIYVLSPNYYLVVDSNICGSPYGVAIFNKRQCTPPEAGKEIFGPVCPYFR